ncbi:MAG TPA: endo-1,4-beta-xylanase, partial [Pyrinomonadaceae bacterium]|nr:endo-1,4-beta-xylanase [Pyrinomonadaceae bacterium]
MNRRSFLKTAVAGPALAWPFLVCSVSVRDLTMADDEVLLRAEEHIAQHRRGPGTVAVRTADGRPVPGAIVRLEQIRHAFLFGCNLFRFGQINDPDREQAYRERFAALLNYATLPFFWAGYEPKRGYPQYASTDEMVDWCQRQGILCKGHPLVWDHPVSAPEWLPVDPGDVQRLSTERVRDIVERFTGRINIWDVVNEPTDLTRFLNPMNTTAVRLGAVPFTRLHLRVARTANPAATLLINDYLTTAEYYRILEGLHEDGKPVFDAIGLQSHMHEVRWPLQNIWEICDRYGRLGVPIHFTETSVISGRRLREHLWGETTPEGEARQANEVTK